MIFNVGDNNNYDYGVISAHEPFYYDTSTPSQPIIGSLLPLTNNQLVIVKDTNVGGLYGAGLNKSVDDYIPVGIYRINGVSNVVRGADNKRYYTFETYTKVGEYTENLDRKVSCLDEDNEKTKHKLGFCLTKNDIDSTLSSTDSDKVLSAAMGKLLYEYLTTQVVHYADVVNNLTSGLVGKPLSAYQGKVLNDKITTANTNITNLTNKSVKYKDVTLSNVAITTKSAYGAYYSDGTAMSGVVSSYTAILSILVIGWNHAIASFNPYFQDGKIRFLSDVSQTVTSIVVRVAYI